MAQLAIKAHPTRTKEVIEILEMLGGKNRYHFKGDEDEWFVLNGNIQRSDRLFAEKGFTLEEFLEKYPYKVGDKVQHKGATSCGSVFEVEKMRWEEDTVKYTLYLFGCNYKTSTLPTDYLQPYKEETMEERKYAELRMPLDDDDKLATEVTIDDNKILPPENHLIGKITKVENGMLVEFVKKQPQYPKTYKECCEVLSLNSERATWGIEGLEYKRRLIVCFQRLLICRDAYWKVAGEQMGLGKPWEHDMSKDEFSSAISYQYGYIQKCEVRHQNEILIFPTKEMRDAFYENFKELIELVKELL